MPKVRTPYPEFYNYALNTEFVAAVGMFQKMESQFENWNYFNTNSLFKNFDNHFPFSKIKILTWQSFRTTHKTRPGEDPYYYLERP